MERLTAEQIAIINKGLRKYPSSQFVQAITSMAEKIHSITRSLGQHARLGMTSIGIMTKRGVSLSLKNTFRCL